MVGFRLTKDYKTRLGGLLEHKLIKRSLSGRVADADVDIKIKHNDTADEEI